MNSGRDLQNSESYTKKAGITRRKDVSGVSDKTNSFVPMNSKPGDIINSSDESEIPEVSTTAELTTKEMVIDTDTKASAKDISTPAQKSTLKEEIKEEINTTTPTKAITTHAQKSTSEAETNIISEKLLMICFVIVFYLHCITCKNT